MFEQFRLRLSEPVNAVLGADDEKLARINDNDAAPTLDLLPGPAVSVAEGGAVGFTVRLSAPTALPVNLLYETLNGTATAPGDYTRDERAGESADPARRETGRTFVVSTTDDALDEEDTETFSVRIRRDPLLDFNATLGANLTTVTIDDNDGPARIAGCGRVGA